MPAYGILLGFADMSEDIGHPYFAAIRKRTGITVVHIERPRGKEKFRVICNRRPTADERAEIAAFIAAKERRRRTKR